MFLNLLASVGIFSWLLHHAGISQAAAFFAAFLFVWGFILVGFIMLIGGKRTIGAVLVTIGSLIFVPVGVGLVAIVGSIRVALRKDPVPELRDVR
ncbi:hypothetical protein CY652_23155 [Burkholderia sp. WAC0059]|nr:hypothetical protein CY652_23155 [Burkholderia sp. WAC0059]